MELEKKIKNKVMKEDGKKLMKRERNKNRANKM
jgi:hypothetical protein